MPTRAALGTTVPNGQSPLQELPWSLSELLEDLRKGFRKQDYCLAFDLSAKVCKNWKVSEEEIKFSFLGFLITYFIEG